MRIKRFDHNGRRYDPDLPTAEKPLCFRLWSALCPFTSRQLPTAAR
jgi:hypothetical protein